MIPGVMRSGISFIFPRILLNKSFAYICKNYFIMSETQSTLKYWIYFLISAVGIILMLVYVREYFWMVLPFVVTTFGKALKII